MKKRLKFRVKGFSLMEAMLSVFLVSFGIVAIMPLLSKGLTETFGSRDQMIAALLAQEGIEIMRNIRDNHWAAGSPGGNDFPNDLNSNGVSCTLGYDNSSCSSGSKQIYLKNNFYTNDSTGSATPTKFHRQIRVNVTGSSRVVTSMVTWTGNNSFPNLASCTTINKCVYSEVELTNWGS